MNILSGAESLVILSDSSGYYDLSVRPLRRGIYRGVIAFVGQQPEMWVSYCGLVLNYLFRGCSRRHIFSHVTSDVTKLVKILIHRMRILTFKIHQMRILTFKIHQMRIVAFIL